MATFPCSGRVTDCAAVATGHPVCTRAAADILESGGNAYDAWVAAVACSCVAEPVLASLGGGGFALVVPADGEPAVFDFFTETPGRRPDDPENLDFAPFVAGFGTEDQTFRMGWGSCAVPGMVSGIFELHRRLGRMPIREALAPAIRAAKEGVKLNAGQRLTLELTKGALLSKPEGRAMFASRSVPGDVLQVGEVLRMPDFADFLECVALEGPDLFYRGEVAAAVAAEGIPGGVLRRTDFEAYATAIRDPLRVGIDGAEMLTNPMPAAGGALCAVACELLDGMRLALLEPFSDLHARLIARTLGRCVDIESNPDWEPARGRDGGGADAGWIQEMRRLRFACAGTTHVSLADRWGNLLSATASNGAGSGCVIPGTGILMNNMLGEAELNPAGFHVWPVGRRLTSMMAPTVLRRAEGARIAFGTGGSRRIPSATIQVAVYLAVHGMSLEKAIRSPRLHVVDGRLSVEGGFDPDELQQTLADWPDHRLWNELHLFFGGVQAVEVAASAVDAFADPRRGGTAWVG